MALGSSPSPTHRGSPKLLGAGTVTISGWENAVLAGAGGQLLDGGKASPKRCLLALPQLFLLPLLAPCTTAVLTENPLLLQV